MSKQATYQIVLFKKKAFNKAIVETVKSSFLKVLKDLGLNKNEVKFFTENDFDKLDKALPTVALYFGNSNKEHPNHKSMLLKLRSNGVFVLPVVSNLSTFGQDIPSYLADINGFELSTSNTVQLVNIILEQFKLIRHKRHAFISYKRNESRNIALQLYQSLDERSFEVFLDTHTIKRGEEFQPMLWDNMADADLVIFLDTPNAMTSTYVKQEIARAHAQGIAVLQVVWPNHTRSREMELCEVIYLKPTDIVGDYLNPKSRLSKSALSNILSQAEGLRARSFAARRLRLIGLIERVVSSLKLQMSVQKSGQLHIKKNKKMTKIFPLVGHPDAVEIHNVFANAEQSDLIAYDGSGIWIKKSEHLTWLNNYLPLKALKISTLIRKLKSL